MKNNKLIFGSTALKHWFPDFKREPKDLDYICKDGKSTKEIECHWANGFQYILDNNVDETYVDANFLYTIKMSHAGWDVRWDKTMHDIRFLKSKNCVLNKNLFDLLLKDWDIIHYKKKIKIEGNGKTFFNSNIKRIIPHDDLHEMVKFYEQPMYYSILLSHDNVKCSGNLWNVLSHEDKMKCALEEAYVFALERYINYPPQHALTKALKQLITKSTKGYFNLFLIDNFFELLYYNDSTKYLNAHKTLRLGTI